MRNNRDLSVLNGLSPIALALMAGAKRAHALMNVRTRTELRAQACVGSIGYNVVQEVGYVFKNGS